jgi:putative transcription antitermination factor YqgF
MILALDYGEKRIGTAVMDETGRYAKALDFIPNKSEGKKIFAKDFPSQTDQKIINEARKAAKRESKVEFRKLCNKLLYLINCYYPEKILIGLPTTIDEEGKVTEGAQAKKVRDFAKRLESCLKQNQISLEIEFIEESLTSQMAEHNLRQQGYSSKSIEEKIDSESARVMLQEYINK